MASIWYIICRFHWHWLHVSRKPVHIVGLPRKMKPELHLFGFVELSFESSFWLRLIGDLLWPLKFSVRIINYWIRLRSGSSRPRILKSLVIDESIILASFAGRLRAAHWEPKKPRESSDEGREDRRFDSQPWVGTEKLSVTRRTHKHV